VKPGEEPAGWRNLSVSGKCPYGPGAHKNSDGEVRQVRSGHRHRLRNVRGGCEDEAFHSAKPHALSDGKAETWQLYRVRVRERAMG
jgi:hypothetical protein